MSHEMSAARRKRKIPILVWVVIAALAIWLAYILIAPGSRHVTPSGETYPQPRPEASDMPPVPSTDAAPGTEGGTVVTPNPAAQGPQ